MAKNNGEKGVALTTIRRAAGLSQERWNDERLNAVVAMFAGNAKSPGQAAVFLAVADRYDLAPEMGEIWLGEIRGRPTVLVGRDAYIKVAQKDPGYRGFQADIVREGDDFTVERNGAEVVIHHQKKGFGGRGKLLGAYALVPHATRDPVYVEKHLDELQHLMGKDVWKQNTVEMVLTRALTFALKLQYNLTGVYSPADELTDEDLEDIANRDVADSTLSEAERLKQRMKEVKARVKREKEEEEIQEADFEIVGEDEDEEVEAGSGVGRHVPKPEAQKGGEASDAPPPAEAAPEDETEFQRAKGRYFALAGEKFEGESQRQLWQATHMEEKPSASHWSTADYRRAAEMLQEGIGLDPLVDDSPVPWGEPAEAEAGLEMP